MQKIWNWKTYTFVFQLSLASFTEPEKTDYEIGWNETEGFSQSECGAHLSASYSSSGVSWKASRGKRWWKERAKWGAETKVRPVQERRQTVRTEHIDALRKLVYGLKSRDMLRTYHTLYTPLAAQCIWPCTVDSSSRQEWVLVHQRCPGA